MRGGIPARPPQAHPPLNPLEEIVRGLIDRHGPISVADYMALALSHPEHGYYMTRDPLGRGGDFTTSPEISQMFGEMVGAWALAQWQQMGSPSSVALVELGPGRGTLLADLMRVAGKLLPDFVEAATLHLVETSPRLRMVQAERLAGYGPIWHDSLDAIPEMPAIFIANEFFDALPIRQFVATEQGLSERCVAIDAETGELAFRVARENRFPIGIGQHPPGTLLETSPASLAIVRGISRRVVTGGGAALIVDYGYTEPQGDTLQAVQDHRYANVLRNPGEADLTAHVDFAALAGAARQEGAEVSGPLGQGAFLLSLGIAQRAERLATPDAQAALLRLTGADQMGMLFKVMLLLG